MSNNKLSLALLIDGDNAQPSLLPQVITEVNKYGIANIRQLYGDWTTPQMNSWKTILNEYAVEPVQQFRYTTGKNATDSRLIIDAMDILYTSDVSGFCIVSSDSDYTGLATRIRKNNLFVLGIGRANTPPAFVNACNAFVYTEDLQNNKANEDKSTQNGKSQSPVTVPQKLSGKKRKQMMKLFNAAFGLAAQDNGWADLSAMGNFLRQIDPGFDPKTYGHKQLSKLVQHYSHMFEVRTSGSKTAPIYKVRMKK